jgi:phosphoglycerol transferase MdoB-like AlkP superfamily enzyme
MRPFAAFIKQFRIILLFLAVLLGVYTGLRILFWIDNRAFFIGSNWKEGLEIFAWGLRMDLSGLVNLNLPVFLFLFMAQIFHAKNKRFIIIALSLFILLNISGLAINIIDIGYFPFNKHRSNIDLRYVFADSAKSFKKIILIYWPLVLLFFLLSAGLIRLAKKIFVPELTPPSLPVLLARQFIMILLLFLLARGLGPRPLIPASPLIDIEAKQLPLAQNTINTFVYSILRKQQELEQKAYFSQPELDKIVSTHHFLRAVNSNGAEETFKKKNVVLCILESFSACYLRPGDPLKAKTPFFDSLIRKSLFFPNAYANGYSSNQGIVAILGGLPALLDEPFYYSIYANTPLMSIGNILKEKGYNTNFFLGAGRDHFGFGKFTRMAGIDHYYSGVDFNDDRFDDGNWGIFDEPFLQFGAAVLEKKRQPFFAVFFNISSHPPFTIPAQQQQEFAFPDQSPAQRSISYVDFSFSRFFETCKKSSWFQNSIFVFCADHWLYPGPGYPANYVNSSSIPIFIYDPSLDLGSVDDQVAGQVDLTPTLLELLHYKGPYFGFGRSLLDSSDSMRYVINMPGGIPQIIDKDFVLGYDVSREKSKYLYRYHSDSLMKNNLLDDQQFAGVSKQLETLIKANIQAYNQALIRRSLE